MEKRWGVGRVLLVMGLGVLLFGLVSYVYAAATFNPGHSPLEVCGDGACFSSPGNLDLSVSGANPALKLERTDAGPATYVELSLDSSGYAYLLSDAYSQLNLGDNSNNIDLNLDGDLNVDRGKITIVDGVGGQLILNSSGVTFPDGFEQTKAFRNDARVESEVGFGPIFSRTCNNLARSIVGGGCRCSSGSVIASYPSPTGQDQWNCECSSGSGGTAWAICLF